MKGFKKEQNISAVLFFSVAIILVLGISIGYAWSYFSTFAGTSGTRPIRLGSTTDIFEDVKETTKTVWIKNLPGSQPAYVRVKAFAGTEDGVAASDYDEKYWRQEADGYYYYQFPLAENEETRDETGKEKKHIVFTITLPPEGSDELLTRDDQEIVIIHESVPVQYTGDAPGTPIGLNGPDYVGWKEKANVVERE